MLIKIKGMMQTWSAHHPINRVSHQLVTRSANHLHINNNSILRYSKAPIILINNNYNNHSNQNRKILMSRSRSSQSHSNIIPNSWLINNPLFFTVESFTAGTCLLSILFWTSMFSESVRMTRILNLAEAATCSHLQPLARSSHLLGAATWAATCSHLPRRQTPASRRSTNLTGEFSTFSGGRHRKIINMQFDYFPCNGCKWLQVAASGCKWLLWASGCKWLHQWPLLQRVDASGLKWMLKWPLAPTCPGAFFSQITTWTAQWLWLFSLVFESFPARNSAHQPVQKVTPTFFPHGTPMISGQNLSWTNLQNGKTPCKRNLHNCQKKYV